MIEVDPLVHTNCCLSPDSQSGVILNGTIESHAVAMIKDECTDFDLLSKKKMCKRKTLNISEKVDLIRDVDNFPHKRKKDIAAKYGIPVNTLSTIYANKDRIIEQCTKNFVNLKMKKIRASSYPDIEEALLDWYVKNHAREGDGYVSGMVLRTEALQLARMFGHKNFLASNGWIERFKARHNITVRNPRKKNNAIKSTSPKDFSSSRTAAVLPKSNAIWENIYNPVMELKEYAEVYNGSSYNNQTAGVTCFENKPQTGSQEIVEFGSRQLENMHTEISDKVEMDMESSELDMSSDRLSFEGADHRINNFEENASFYDDISHSIPSDQEAEEAVCVLFRYIKSCENVSHKTFQMLQEISNFIAKEKNARKQTKITDFFGSV